MISQQHQGVTYLDRYLEANCFDEIFMVPPQSATCCMVSFLSTIVESLFGRVKNYKIRRQTFSLKTIAFRRRIPVGFTGKAVQLIEILSVACKITEEDPIINELQLSNLNIDMQRITDIWRNLVRYPGIQGEAAEE